MARIGCRHGPREILKSAESSHRAIRIGLPNLQSPNRTSPFHCIRSGIRISPRVSHQAPKSAKSEMHHSPRFHTRLEFNGMVHRFTPSSLRRLRSFLASPFSASRPRRQKNRQTDRHTFPPFHHSTSSPPSLVKPQWSCQSRADTLDNVRPAPPLRGSAGRPQSDASRAGFLRIVAP